MIGDIWQSFRRLPAWVQIWVAAILVPVNAASVFFWFQPSGQILTILAIGGMVPNIGILLYERGFSKRMSLPHLVIWPPLVLIVLLLLTRNSGLPPLYRSYLSLLLVVDIISLGFDWVDMRKWLRGDRQIA